MRPLTTGRDVPSVSTIRAVAVSSAGFSTPTSLAAAARITFLLRAKKLSGTKALTHRCRKVQHAPTPRGGVAQLVRALPCHGRGYGFEPRHSRHFSFRKVFSPHPLRLEPCFPTDGFGVLPKRFRYLTGPECCPSVVVSGIGARTPKPSARAMYRPSGWAS